MHADIEKIIAYLKYNKIKPAGIKGNENFYWRYFLQKTTRILHGLGMEFSYCWTIRVRGPYSYQLANDYYQFENEFTSLETTYELLEKDLEISNKLKEIVFPKITDADGLHYDSPYLESISTAFDLMSTDKNTEDDKIFVWMKKFKPHLDDETIVIGINSAKELLFKPEDLTEELKKEFNDWEKFD